MTIKTFEAFAGYGSQLMALRRLEKDFPDFHVVPIGISEIDENPIKAYQAVHGDVPNYGDISKIDWNSVPDFDLFTYSFPCQDISSAGYQNGFAEGSGTRSSLLWECEKAIKAKRPKYLVMENVKQLYNKNNMPLFMKWLKILESYGYVSHCKILNSKHYGIAQNRERAFCVSILNEQPNSDFYHFPEPFALTTCIKDYLDNPIDPDTFYNDKYLANLHWYDNVTKTKNSDIIKVGNMFASNHSAGTIHSIEGTSSCVMLNHGTGIMVAIDQPDGTRKVKKLSASEMFRLMGVNDEDIAKMTQACGKTATWKLAGNSIVVDVLYHIFKSIFIHKV